MLASFTARESESRQGLLSPPRIWNRNRSQVPPRSVPFPFLFPTPLHQFRPITLSFSRLSSPVFPPFPFLFSFFCSISPSSSPSRELHILNLGKVSGSAINSPHGSWRRPVTRRFGGSINQQANSASGDSNLYRIGLHPYQNSFPYAHQVYGQKRLTAAAVLFSASSQRF